MTLRRYWDFVLGLNLVWQVLGILIVASLGVTIIGLVVFLFGGTELVLMTGAALCSIATVIFVMVGVSNIDLPPRRGRA